jgi:hypothetical protein
MTLTSARGWPGLSQNYPRRIARKQAEAKAHDAAMAKAKTAVDRYFEPKRRRHEKIAAALNAVAAARRADAEHQRALKRAESGG